MECVDWNPKTYAEYLKRLESHSVMECVDWNNFRGSLLESLHVALCNGVRGLKSPRRG